MPPTMAITLYRSHIDPHLTGGCEIALDVRPTTLNGLKRIQHCFLRRALHISPHSQIAPLHSETGVWPLPYRRVDLTLVYLHYLLAARPVLTHAALRESWALVTAPRASASWWGDLTITATNLPVPLALPIHSWPTTDAVDAYRAALPALVSEYLYDLILASQRLPDMQTRVRFDSPATSRPIAKLCAMREYLRLPRHRQRAAITLLLLSEHPLSVEQLRRGPKRLDRCLRICRWCKNDWAVEDEIHVLLECDAEPIASRRSTFLKDVVTALPSLRTAHFRLASSAFLDMLLRGPTTPPLLATYVADVFELCDNTPPPLLPDDNTPPPDIDGMA
ncbi:hypothetical protein VTO73DRAFT_15135 [Trametes versicolor]